jgi:6-phosphogluconate dehydrogenase (decarboxylating)
MAGTGTAAGIASSPSGSTTRNSVIGTSSSPMHSKPAAIDLDVSAPVITLALMRRIGSRDEIDFSDRVLSALRGQFGGHVVKREG